MPDKEIDVTSFSNYENLKLILHTESHYGIPFLLWFFFYIFKSDYFISKCGKVGSCFTTIDAVLSVWQQIYYFLFADKNSSRESSYHVSIKVEAIKQILLRTSNTTNN